MLNRVDGSLVGSSDPGYDGFLISASDSEDLVAQTRAIWVGSGGSLAVVMAGGSSLTFENVPGGSLLPIQASRVMATGTTASGLVGVV